MATRLHLLLMLLLLTGTHYYATSAQGELQQMQTALEIVQGGGEIFFS